MIRTGSDIALDRDAASGRFNFAWGPGGDVSFDDSEEHAVLSCLLEHRAEWWADTDGTHGSELHTLKDMRRSTPSQAEAFAAQALQPLFDRHLIQDIAARASRAPSGGLRVDVSWETPGGRPQKTRISL